MWSEFNESNISVVAFRHNVVLSTSSGFKRLSVLAIFKDQRLVTQTDIILPDSWTFSQILSIRSETNII